ncbi:MAG: hypothetical protein ACI9QL_004108 [Candidatus Omnitrophota bacterium]|jgi:hypothetical protein
MDLPAADALFLTYFAPWYPQEIERPYPATRPDLEEVVLPEGTHISVLNPLTPEGIQAARDQISGMRKAAEADFPTLLDTEEPLSLDWLRATDTWCTPEAVANLLEQSDPKNFANNYVVVACELGVAIGEALIQEQPGLQWLHDWPYWDSAIFDLNSKTKINVFHWAFKKLSGDGMEDALMEKVTASLDFVRQADVG